MKFPKLKFHLNVDYKKLGLMLLASCISAVFFATVLISLPQTERFHQIINYDLTLKTKPWSKEYILELNLQNDQINSKDKYIDQTRNVILKRLQSYGILDVQISKINTETPNKPRIKVDVSSDLNTDDIDRLVLQRYFFRFVTRKDGVNFEDEKNQLAPYEPSNYNETDFTRWSFRNIYIKQLKTTTGTMAYFAIYKPWESDAEKFYSTFDPLANQYAGIMVDGFVNPITVPETKQVNQSNVITRSPFAIALSTDTKSAKIQDILLNSGVIPAEYSQISSYTPKSSNYDVNIYIAAGVIVGIILVLLMSNKIVFKLPIDIASYLFTTLLAVSTSITHDKVFQTPMSLFSLFLGTTIFVITNFIICSTGEYKRKFQLTFITIFMFFILTNAGISKYIGEVIITYQITAFVFDIIYPWYKSLILKAIK